MSEPMSEPLAEAASQSLDPAAERRARWAVALLLCALPFLFFAPVWLNGLALAPGDGLSQNLGVRVLVGQMLRAGQWPLWNPWMFAGTPLLASIYPGVLYPPNWLFIGLGPKLALNLVVITTYHIALIGTYLFARRSGMTRLGALLAGIGFSFGGYMIAHLGHTSRIAAAAWLPWILLALEQLYQRVQWRWIALGAACIALQLFAGEPQMNFYTALVAGAYAVYALFVREERAPRLRFVAGLAAMAVTGALLSAIQLLPERELLQQGERARIAYDYFAGYSLPPGNFVTFLFPFFFGGGMAWPYKVEYWGVDTIDETSGYFGLATLLLGVLAVCAARGRQFGRWKLVWFWAGAALVSFVLAWGDYLPLGLNYVLYLTPVYNLFRASGRHMYEFTFAWGMLAGWGATALAELKTEQWRSALRRSSQIFLGLLALTALSYLFVGKYLVTGLKPTAGAQQLTNPEFLVPLLLAALSLSAVWLFARQRRAVFAAALVLIVFADLLTTALAFNWGWREFVSKLEQKLQDPPAVQFIKSREPDLNAFRVVAYAASPSSPAYHELNLPNVSLVRGLQMVNGYDALRLSRVGEAAADMYWDGIPYDRNGLSVTHQGFDMLNVKYLLRERFKNDDKAALIEHAGIQFLKEPLQLLLNNGGQAVFEQPGTATELALISALGNSDKLSNGQPVLRLKLFTNDGRVIEHEIQAGRDTSEWAYDRPDVRARIQHQRAPVIETWSAGDFEGHRYLARLKFDRAAITHIEVNHVNPSADLTLYQVSLFDAETNTSTPLDQTAPPPRRWRLLKTFGPVEVYENLRFLPRAWFARRAAVLPRQGVLQALKTGELSPGAPFNVAETVLFEKEDFGARPPIPPAFGEPTDAEVKVTRFEPNRLELQTRNAQAGLLVLSEIYYRGWEARVDGQRVPVERVNYVLRGLALSPGAHRVEVIFRAHSFRNGATYTAVGVLLLLLGAAFTGTSGGQALGQRWLGERQPRAEKAFSQSVARWQQTALAYWAQPAQLWRRLPRHSELVFIAGLGVLALLFVYLVRQIGLPIRSDGVGYYLYLPSVFFKHTLALDEMARQQFGNDFDQWAGIWKYPETGRYLNKYALGEALLMAPFFVLGHLVALLTGATRNGFSWPYQAAAAVSGLFYALAGLGMLKRVLAERFTPRTVVITLLVITFATNLFHYATCDNIFTHSYSFFLFSCLLYLAPRWHRETDWRTTALVAVVSGLITLVRPTNAVVLLFVPLLGVNTWAAAGARLRFIGRHLDKAIGGCVIYLLTVAPMLLYWKWATNHWIVDPYQVPFYWTRPEILNVLFSVRKGLFFWSPILLLAVAGFALTGRYWKGFVLPAALFLLAQIYLVASWEAWAFGGSFGHRAFTEALCIFAVGYASLLEFSQTKPRLAQTVNVASVLCVLLSVKLMLQYWLGVIPYDETTWAQFVGNFFKMWL